MTLHIQGVFNQPLDNLPENLQVLHFAMEFGRPHITNSEFSQNLDKLPASLKSLDLRGARRYNKPLMNLPMNLKYLALSDYYQATLGALPASLAVLIGYNYIKPIRPPLPQGLTHLAIKFTNSFDDFQNLPASLTHFKNGSPPIRANDSFNSDNWLGKYYDPHYEIFVDFFEGEFFDIRVAPSQFFGSCNCDYDSDNDSYSDSDGDNDNDSDSDNGSSDGGESGGNSDGDGGNICATGNADFGDCSDNNNNDNSNNESDSSDDSDNSDDSGHKKKKIKLQ